MDRTRATWIASMMVLTAGLAAHTIRARDTTAPPSLGLDRATLELGDQPFVARDLDPEFLALLRPREVLYRTYAADGPEPVWVFLSYFDRPREGSQVHSPRHCYPGAGWSIERELRRDVPWRSEKLHALVVDDGVERRLVCYWYQTSRRIVGDAFELKLALMRQAIARAPQDVVFANVSTPVTAGSVDAAFERVQPYARAVEDELSRLYRERDEHQPNSH